MSHELPTDDNTLPTVNEPAARYERLSSLGQGAFGEVWKARDRELNRPVALKVLREKHRKADKTVKRLKREAHALANLNHPHICAVYDVFSENDQLHLVLEFIEGTTLRDRMKAGLDPTEVLHIVRKIADAIGHAHEKGIVHRDLKPENIMIRPNGEPVVMDFGLCGWDDDQSLTIDGQIFGTPYYMSPEQAKGETASIGPSSDQFSLGIILYEMLCGRRPFQAENRHALLKIIIEEDPPAPEHNAKSLEPKLNDALLQALDKQPNQRHATIAEFAKAVEACLPPVSRAERGPQHSIPHNLPFPSIGNLFKGRDGALMELREMLDGAAGHATAIVAAQLIHGLGGVGKSQLAVEFAWKHQDHYTAMLFVKADTADNLRAGLAGLCETLELPERNVADQDVRADAVLGWLADNPGWLLILDNVDDKPAAEAVQQFVTGLGGGDVLITGRWTMFGDAIQKMELDVLAEDKAAEYLLEKTHGKRRATESDYDAALELARRLGGLAVSLEHAAAYIVQHRGSIADYHKAWEENFQATADWHEKMLVNYPHSVLATWVTTIDRLAREARELLDRLSWLATDPIPECLLDEHRAAANELVDHSMLKWDNETDTWRMHRVVQEVTRSRIPSADQPESLQATLQAVNDVAQGEPADVRTWDVWDPLRPHIAAVVRHADEHDIHDPTTRLMGQLGVLLWAKALHAEAEPLKRRALELDEQAHGPESSEVAVRLNNLAQLLKATNRLSEAEPLMRRHVEILVKFGKATEHEHPHMRAGIGNYERLLQEMGLSNQKLSQRLEDVRE